MWCAYVTQKWQTHQWCQVKITTLVLKQNSNSTIEFSPRVSLDGPVVFISLLDGIGTLCIFSAYSFPLQLSASLSPAPWSTGPDNPIKYTSLLSEIKVAKEGQSSWKVAFINISTLMKYHHINAMCNVIAFTMRASGMLFDQLFRENMPTATLKIYSENSWFICEHRGERDLKGTTFSDEVRETIDVSCEWLSLYCKLLVWIVLLV